MTNLVLFYIWAGCGVLIKAGQSEDVLNDWECIGTSRIFYVGTFLQMEVNMYRKTQGKRLASVFWLALITATVPVQAAEFRHRTVWKDFSSGKIHAQLIQKNTLPAASDSEKVMASELSCNTNSDFDTGGYTCIDRNTDFPSVTPMPSSTPTPSVTPSPSPTPTINPEKGNAPVYRRRRKCEQLRTVMSWGESLILPNVPDTGAPDMWKLKMKNKTWRCDHSEGWIFLLKKARAGICFSKKASWTSICQRNVRFPL